MILITMATGRNPWRSARRSDDYFAAFLEEPDFLRTMLPLSNSVIALLRRILVLDPQARISIAEIRAEVLAIDTFFMTAAELQSAYPHVVELTRTYLKLSMDAAQFANVAPLVATHGDLTELQLGNPHPIRVAANEPPSRPILNPPGADNSSYSSLSPVLAASGLTLAASSSGPITPENHAVADADIADALGSFEEISLSQTDAPAYNRGEVTVASVKKEWTINLIHRPTHQFLPAH
jgi:serine/threonine protein kinase